MEQLEIAHMGPKRSVIGKTLETLIKNSGKTVRDIAKEMHINEQTLYSMEKQTTNRVDLELLKTVADYFHKDINVFFGYEQYREPVKLSREEEQMLSRYRRMNKFGKARMEEYAMDLSQNEKYLEKP